MKRLKGHIGVCDIILCEIVNPNPSGLAIYFGKFDRVFAVFSIGYEPRFIVFSNYSP
jgi:hypothetical protein